MVSPRRRYAVLSVAALSVLTFYFSVYRREALSVPQIPARLTNYFYDVTEKSPLKGDSGDDEPEIDPYAYLTKTTYPPAPAPTASSSAAPTLPLKPYIHDNNVSDTHPIAQLLAGSDKAQEELLRKPQATELSKAAKLYRERRGRHPPPGFDKWFEYAEEQGGLILEEFFDQIYRDITPYWGLTAEQIREDIAVNVANGEFVIRIRDGEVSQTYPNPGAETYNIYYSMMQQLKDHLPDVDITINDMDEPRVLVEWEDMAELVATGERNKSLETLPTIHKYPSLSTNDTEIAGDKEHVWEQEAPYWNIVRAGCPPESPSRNTSFEKPKGPAEFPDTWPSHSYKGFVSNWTLAKDPCQHPDIRYLHASFVEPLSQKASKKLLSFFSRSKLPVNNDILLPPALYWHETGHFSLSGSDIDWSEKRDEVFWRGVASGGRNHEDNWTRFHRQRLVSMLNGTTLQTVLEYLDSTKGDNEASIPGNFPLPNQELYPLSSLNNGTLGTWLGNVSNVGLVSMNCYPSSGADGFSCPYNSAWFQHGGDVSFSDFFQAKYLPDADGNSFSGRYKAFLQSNSVPLKATVYSEWHDDRLIPWKHFVPMDNTHMDLYAILEWLFEHDTEAEAIGKEGSKWAQKVLRKEDMMVYVYRLMLEFARVCSDDRERMGWAEDLSAQGKDSPKMMR